MKNFYHFNSHNLKIRYKSPYYILYKKKKFLFIPYWSIISASYKLEDMGNEYRSIKSAESAMEGLVNQSTTTPMNLK